MTFTAFARRARALSAIVLFAFGTTACNVDWERILEAFTSKPKKTKTRTRSRDKEDEAPPKTSATEPTARIGKGGDLGFASFPAGNVDPKVVHEWDTASIAPKHFSLTYSLARRSAGLLSENFKAYAERVHYVSGEAHKFKWIPPPGCEHDMGCVFQELKEEDRDAVAPVITLFRAKQKAGKLDALELAQLVVNFVQDIPYEEPDDEPFGMLPPALVLSESNGDCDSKSLLAHMILAEFGIDSILLSSVAHRHAMLGIALPVKGTKMVVEGREYAFTELTAKGAVIGYLFPNNAKPNDWKPVILRRPKNALPPKPR